MKETLHALIIQLQNNPNLLSEITYSSHAQRAVNTLSLLCEQIQGSPVLEFIQLHTYEDVKVLSKWSNNTLCSLSAPVPLMADRSQIPQNAGVYL